MSQESQSQQSNDPQQQTQFPMAQFSQTMGPSLKMGPPPMMGQPPMMNQPLNFAAPSFPGQMPFSQPGTFKPMGMGPPMGGGGQMGPPMQMGGQMGPPMQMGGQMGPPIQMGGQMGPPMQMGGQIGQQMQMGPPKMPPMLPSMGAPMGPPPSMPSFGMFQPPSMDSSNAVNGLPFMQTIVNPEQNNLLEQQLKLEATIQDQNKQIQDLKKKLKDSEEESTEKNDQMEKERKRLQNEIQNQKNNLKAVEVQFQQDLDEQYQFNSKLKSELQLVKQQNEKLMRDLKVRDQSISNLEDQLNERPQIQPQNNVFIQSQQAIPQIDQQQMQKIKQLNQQISSLQDELSITKDQLYAAQNDLNQKVQQLKNTEQKLNGIQSSYNQLNQAFGDVQKKLVQTENDSSEKQSEINKNLTLLSNRLSDIQHELNTMRIEKEHQEKLKQYYQEELNKANQTITDIQNNRKIGVEFTIPSVIENSQNAYLEQLNAQKERMILQLQQQKDEEMAKQMKLNEQGILLKGQMLAKLGKIQICFLMDIYKWEKNKKNSLIKGIQETLDCLKNSTGREFFVSSHCYGYTNQKNSATTVPFTNNKQEIFQNLHQQQLQSTNDKPEDIKGSIDIISKLLWTEKFKLVILIPSSPCHGKKYHDPRKYYNWFSWWTKDYDTKPNEDMTQQIETLIKMDIILLIVRFNDETKMMCNELEKVYARHDKRHLLHVVSLKDKNKYEIELKNKILKLTGTLIGTDNKSTKTKTNQNNRIANFQDGLEEMAQIKQEFVEINQEIVAKAGNKDQQIIQQQAQAQQDQIQYEKEIERIKNQDGALQALCRRGDIQSFETRVATQKFRCQVFKVELKEQSFTQKKEIIEKIKLDDFDIIKENEWECIRTNNPFAYGMVKQVYLMKKQGQQDQIYVVKIPIETGCYKSIEEAVKDCRSHLIAKHMMKSFIDKVKDKNPNLPNVVYTDFLLLQEFPNKIWLAERFFKGDFEKYNNNDGYINEVENPLNQLAQAFSYYTYQQSQFNYVVTDIQGVGTYFTDPAINTTRGNFDETDAGEEGIGNFLGTLETKKQLCESLLKSIGIEMD